MGVELLDLNRLVNLVKSLKIGLRPGPGIVASGGPGQIIVLSCQLEGILSDVSPMPLAGFRRHYPLLLIPGSGAVRRRY